MKLLLVPGWAMTRDCWRLFRAELGNEFEYSSTEWKDVSTLDDIPGTVGSLIGREGTGHILCGWSMGGMACIEYLAEHPGSVKALILISTCASFIRRPGFEAGWNRSVLERMKKKLDTDRQGMLSDFIGSISACGKDLEAVKKEIHASVDHSVSNDTLRTGLDYLLSRDLREAAKKINVPVLIIHGSDDRTVKPSSAELLRSLLPGKNKFVILECGGHAPLISSPKECADAVREFLS
jgi:pimeloyl-[acyl-carrier protein] methyl ester esterase